MAVFSFALCSLIAGSRGEPGRVGNSVFEIVLQEFPFQCRDRCLKRSRGINGLTSIPVPLHQSSYRSLDPLAEDRNFVDPVQQFVVQVLNLGLAHETTTCNSPARDLSVVTYLITRSWPAIYSLGLSVWIVPAISKDSYSPHSFSSIFKYSPEA